jgi:tetratricopeptide (TPR) repeat protein
MSQDKPDFRSVAQLFQVPILPDEELEGLAEVDRSKVGENAEESEALGRAFLNEGDYDKAIEHFRRACTQREPGDIHSQVELAGAMDAADRAPEAFRQYLKAIRAQQGAVEPKVGMSEILKRYGRTGDSIKLLIEAADADPSNAYLRIKVAEALRDNGQPKAALEWAVRAVAIAPEDSFNHAWVGDHLLSMGRNAEALESLRAALELSPGDDYLYLRAAVGFWRENRPKEAIKALVTAIELDPERGMTHAALVRFYNETDQVMEAQVAEEVMPTLDRYDEDLLHKFLVECGLEPA